MEEFIQFSSLPVLVTATIPLPAPWISARTWASPFGRVVGVRCRDFTLPALLSAVFRKLRNRLFRNIRKAFGRMRENFAGSLSLFHYYGRMIFTGSLSTETENVFWIPADSPSLCTARGTELKTSTFLQRKI